MKLQLESTLTDIVSTVKDAGYAESHQLHIGQDTLESTTWRMYTKPGDNNLVSIAYVSDASELLARQTFTAGVESKSDIAAETKMLEELLKNYKSGELEIQQAVEKGKRIAGYSAGAGALIGFVVARTPGAVLGAFAFGIAGYVAGAYTVMQKERALEQYLNNHNIKTGDAALAIFSNWSGKHE